MARTFNGVVHCSEVQDTMAALCQMRSDGGNPSVEQSEEERVFGERCLHDLSAALD